MEITITVPGTITFESRGEMFGFEIAKVDEAKRAEFAQLVFIAGICKAGVDAASSAKTYGEENKMSIEAATRVLVDKRLKTWYAGDWSSRGVGTGEDAVTTMAKSKLREVVKTADKAKYKNAEPAVRDEMVDAAWAKLTDKQREAYMAWATKAVAAKKAAADALAAIKLDVQM